MYPKRSPWLQLSKRVAYGIILIASIFLLPWWITLFVGVIGVFMFGRYYEMVVAGLVLDATFLPPGEYGRIFASVVFLLVFSGTYWIRTRIRS